MRNVLIRAAKDQCGATAIEYGLIAALIAAVLVVSITAIGGTLNGALNMVAGSFP
jgi:pilus assembly protein Flp/PilA